MKPTYVSVLLAITVFVSGCLNTGPGTDLSTSLSTESEKSPATETLSVEEILTDITSKHPSNYFLLADQLQIQGEFSEATRWYYVAQIRYIAYLLSEPTIRTSADMAVYEEYRERIGIPLIYSASADTNEWTSAIKQALLWHSTHENSFTPKSEHADIYASIELGISDLSAYVAANQSMLRRQRNRERDTEHHQFWSRVSLVPPDEIVDATATAAR